VLSPFFRQHFHDLSKSHWPPLDQADNYTHMTHNWRWQLIRRFLPVIRAQLGCPQIALAVQSTLLVRVFAIICCTAAGATLTMMGFPAPEPTIQIASAGVTGIGEKQNLTVLALLQARRQVRPITQERPDLGIVRLNQISYTALAMPIRLKLKMSLNLSCYKPRR